MLFVFDSAGICSSSFRSWMIAVVSNEEVVTASARRRPKQKPKQRRVPFVAYLSAAELDIDLSPQEVDVAADDARRSVEVSLSRACLLANVSTGGIEARATSVAMLARIAGTAISRRRVMAVLAAEEICISQGLPDECAEGIAERLLTMQ